MLKSQILLCVKVDVRGMQPAGETNRERTFVVFLLICHPLQNKTINLLLRRGKRRV